MEFVIALSLPAVGGVLAVVIALVLWLVGHGDGDGPDDPNAPDEHGFTPADKYGYGYGYSWGDPFGDPDL